jgi:LysR family glycine cleavage system transcriptional activator
MSFKHSLPSLTALVALEAAVRHKSFTRAAQELGVTQTAVSRQIIALEDALGAELFHRRHRAVEPTTQCSQLALALNRHFRGISDSIKDFGCANTSGALTIGATTAFAQLWLLPRLVQFRKSYPEAKIRLTVSDIPFDLENGDEDIVIRYGVAPFADGRTVASRGDVLYPVASPDYAQTFEATEGRFWEASHDLIATESAVRSWYSWQDWFRAVGLPFRPGPPALSFNHFPGTLYAARAGQGIALGWELLVQTFLEDGTLVRLGEGCIIAEGKFHVVLSNRTRPSPTLGLLLTWLSDALNAPMDAEASGSQVMQV